MAQHQLNSDPELIIAGKYSFESGVNGAKQLLAQTKTNVTAIVACNDEIAAGALFAARLLGIEVPQQLSIVGFEDSPFSRQTWPKLSTVNQPNIVIAQTATELLIKNLHKNYQSYAEVFIPEPVIRDSSAKVNR